MDGFYRDGFGQDSFDDADASKRSRKRDSLFLTAQFTIGDAPESALTIPDVRVRNLSEGGLMVEYRKRLPQDTIVTLDLRGIGPVRGRVVWCADGRLGVALDERIDPRMARKPVGEGKAVPFYVKPVPRR